MRAITDSPNSEDLPLFLLLCQFIIRGHGGQWRAKMDTFVDKLRKCANNNQIHICKDSFSQQKALDALSLENLLENLAGRLNTVQYLRRGNALEKEFGMENK